MHEKIIKKSVMEDTMGVPSTKGCYLMTIDKVLLSSMLEVAHVKHMLWAAVGGSFLLCMVVVIYFTITSKNQ